jgi:hypothetical protein
MLDFATIFMLVRVAIGLFLLWLFYRLLRSGMARVRGDGERAKRLRGQLIGFVIAFVLLWPFTGVRLQKRYLEWRYRPQLYEMAATLGYTEEEYLASGASCADPLLTLPQLSHETCRISLYFSTELTAAELEPLVMRFSAPHIVDYKGDRNVTDVLSGIASRLTFNGETLRDLFPFTGKVCSHRWMFHEEDFWTIQTIALHEASHVPGLALDGKPIAKDVIYISVNLGYVSVY